eukprot:scaffold263_cov120-Isochrysis_galbana.AAC.13
MPTPSAGPLLRDHPIYPSYLREREHTVYVALALGGSDFWLYVELYKSTPLLCVSSSAHKKLVKPLNAPPAQCIS